MRPSGLLGPQQRDWPAALARGTQARLHLGAQPPCGRPPFCIVTQVPASSGFPQGHRKGALSAAEDWGLRNTGRKSSCCGSQATASMLREWLSAGGVGREVVVPQAHELPAGSCSFSPDHIGDAGLTVLEMMGQGGLRIHPAGSIILPDTSGLSKGPFVPGSQPQPSARTAPSPPSCPICSQRLPRLH